MIAYEQQQQDDQPAGSMLLGQHFQPPPGGNVDVCDELLHSHINRDKNTLFWVQVVAEDRAVWALIDTRASRNLISQRAYEALPKALTLRPPGSLMVVAGTNQEIHLLGWITLRSTINRRSAYHEFGVETNVPIDKLIG